MTIRDPIRHPDPEAESDADPDSDDAGAGADPDSDSDADFDRDDAVSLEDEATVECPHCGESQLLVIDPETTGQFVQDCDVCCSPWTVTVSRDEDGLLSVFVDSAS